MSSAAVVAPSASVVAPAAGSSSTGSVRPSASSSVTSVSARATTTTVSAAPATTSSVVPAIATTATPSQTTSTRASAQATSSTAVAAGGVNTASEQSGTKDGLSSGAIGGIVGGVAGALLALAVLWLLCSRARNRKLRDKYPLPPPRAMSFAPGTAAVPVTLTAARRASSYGNLISPSTPGTPAGSYYGRSRQPSTSGMSHHHHRSSSYGQPPLDIDSVSPARRLSFETDELPRHTGPGGGVHTPDQASTPSSSDGGSPRILPVDDATSRPMGSRDPSSSRSSSSPPDVGGSTSPPPSSRSNSTRSSSGNEVPTLGSSPLQHEFPRARLRSTTNSNLSPAPHFNSRNSRYSMASIASSTRSRPRSFGPTGSLAPSSALRSGVPHGTRRIELTMPAPLGPPILPTVPDSNSWANGLNDQSRNWNRDAHERRSSWTEQTWPQERKRSSSPLPLHQEREVEAFEEDGAGSDAEVGQGDEEGRQRRP